MVSTTDVDAVVDLIKKENIDGVLTGFIDSMLPYYQAICEKANIPCYLTREQVEIVTNKKKFKELCRAFEVPVVEEFKIEYPLSLEDARHISYPVLIKPVDNSGGRGIRICYSPEELILYYEKSLLFSSCKEVLIERYMDAKEATIFYLIQDGEIYLSSMADRYTNNKKGGIIPLPVAYIFPSKHLKNYQGTINQRLEDVKSIGIKTA